MEPNYLPNQTSSRGKKAWVVLATIVLTAGIVGGGTYYYFNKKADSDLATLQTQLDALKAPATATTAVADPTADWTTLQLTKLNLAIKYPDTWDDAKLTTTPTVKDPTYLTSFGDLKNIVLGYSTDKVTEARGGSSIESYFLKTEEDANSLITRDGKTIGGLFALKATTSSDAPGFEEDMIFAVYFKTGLMYSNIVLEIPDSVENRTIAENMIKSITIGNDLALNTQIYTNVTYKYSMYLPNNFVVATGSTDESISFSLTADDKWMFAANVTKNTGNKSLETVVKEITDEKISTSEPKIEAIITDIKLDGVVAKKYSIPGWGDVGNTGMVVLSDGNIYHLTGFDQNEAGRTVLANAALSFQFTK